MKIEPIETGKIGESRWVVEDLKILAEKINKIIEYINSKKDMKGD